MSSLPEDEQELMARWIAGDISEQDPELQALLERRPELREAGPELRRTRGQLEELAAELPSAWEETQDEDQDDLLLQRAAAAAGIDLLPPRRSGWNGRWILAMAAGLLALLALWRPWQSDPRGPRGYLADPLAVSPVGVVTSFDPFLLREVPGRAEVTIVVYDSEGGELARWSGRGPQWNPSEEQRSRMRQAQDIRWEYRVNDPVSGLQSGQAQASLGDGAESD